MSGLAQLNIADAIAKTATLNVVIGDFYAEHLNHSQIFYEMMGLVYLAVTVRTNRANYLQVIRVIDWSHLLGQN